MIEFLYLGGVCFILESCLFLYNLFHKLDDY